VNIFNCDIDAFCGYIMNNYIIHFGAVLIQLWSDLCAFY